MRLSNMPSDTYTQTLVIGNCILVLPSGTTRFATHFYKPHFIPLSCGEGLNQTRHHTTRVGVRFTPPITFQILFQRAFEAGVRRL
jgi:hypothetical protein